MKLSIKPEDLTKTSTKGKMVTFRISPEEYKALKEFNPQNVSLTIRGLIAAFVSELEKERKTSWIK